MKQMPWQDFIPEIISDKEDIHVDLGSGAVPRNPLNIANVVATDISEIGDIGSNFLHLDLTKKFPFDSNSIFSFSAFDVLEHIPRWERRVDGKITFPFVNLMAEILRCLKPGGYFIATTPGYPSNAAFQDPTHVNFITIDTLELYFSVNSTWASKLDYGFNGGFQIIVNEWLIGEAFSGKIQINNKSIFFNLKRKLKQFNFFVLILRIIQNKPLFEPISTHILWVVQKPSASA